jgi:hypothetical protein
MTIGSKLMRENKTNACKTVGTRFYRVRDSSIGVMGQSIADAIESGPYRFTCIYVLETWYGYYINH